VVFFEAPSTVVIRLTMAPGSRFKRRDSDVSDKPIKPNVLTRSPPSSPQTSEAKSRPREPYPIPSNNPSSQYTLLEKLGTGSFGTVYKAVHNETKQIVAIKQIGELIIYYCPQFERPF
jgi:serine/threonine-protein kinase 24/25/MST4